MQYHRNAKTNLRQRQIIQNSNLSSRKLGQQFCVSHVTISKWKKSNHLEDKKSTPNNIHYAVEKSFWKIVKVVRKSLLLNLDELVHTLQPYLAKLNRSNCYRILLHYHLNRLNIKEKIKKNKFAQYPPGYLHIDVFYLPKINKQQYYCFLAVDRATKMIYLEVYPHRTKEEAADFLIKCLNYFPYYIHHVLTDNGREFVVHGQKIFGRKCEEQTAFEIICELVGIKYHRTKVKHPWTNGMAERMVRTVKENTTKITKYDNISSAIQDIKRFQDIHNFQRKLKAIQFKTPYDITMEWFIKVPDIFIKNPNELLTKR